MTNPILAGESSKSAPTSDSIIADIKTAVLSSMLITVAKRIVLFTT